MLCACVWESRKECAVKLLEEAVAAEKARGGFNDLLPEPLVALLLLGFLCIVESGLSIGFPTFPLNMTLGLLDQLRTPHGDHRHQLTRSVCARTGGNSDLIQRKDKAIPYRFTPTPLLFNIACARIGTSLSASATLRGFSMIIPVCPGYGLDWRLQYSNVEIIWKPTSGCL